MPGLTRVLIVDDDALVRSSLVMLLGADDAIAVLAEASNGEQAVQLAADLRPDVVLMDVRMPEVDGLTATERICAAPDHPAVVVLTTFNTGEYLLQALRAGASGFLLKDLPPLELIEGVKRAGCGEAVLAPASLRQLIEHVASRPRAAEELRSRAAKAAAALAGLNDREREIARGIRAGRSNAEIGVELHLSPASVKVYVSRLLAKLACSNRVQVAIVVHEAEFVELGGN